MLIMSPTHSCLNKTCTRKDKTLFILFSLLPSFQESTTDIHSHAHTITHDHTHSHTCIHTHTHACVCMYMYVHVYACVCTCMCMCVNECACVNHTHTNTENDFPLPIPPPLPLLPEHSGRSVHFQVMESSLLQGHIGSTPCTYGTRELAPSLRCSLDRRGKPCWTLQ